MSDFLTEKGRALKLLLFGETQDTRIQGVDWQRLRKTAVELARIKSPSNIMPEVEHACLLAGVRDQMVRIAFAKGARALAKIRRDHASELDALCHEVIVGPKGLFIGVLSNGTELYDRIGSHLHEGVTSQMLLAAILSVPVNIPAMYTHEHDFGKVIGNTSCVPTQVGDEIVFARRPGRDGLTRWVKNRTVEPCAHVTISIRFSQAQGCYILLTAYIGRKIGREPWNRNDGCSVVFQIRRRS